MIVTLGLHDCNQPYQLLELARSIYNRLKLIKFYCITKNRENRSKTVIDVTATSENPVRYYVTTLHIVT